MPSRTDLERQGDTRIHSNTAHTLTDKMSNPMDMLLNIIQEVTEQQTQDKEAEKKEKRNAYQRYYRARKAIEKIIAKAEEEKRYLEEERQLVLDTTLRLYKGDEEEDDDWHIGCDDDNCSCECAPSRECTHCKEDFTPSKEHARDTICAECVEKDVVQKYACATCSKTSTREHFNWHHETPYCDNCNSEVLYSGRCNCEMCMEAQENEDQYPSKEVMEDWTRRPCWVCREDVSCGNFKEDGRFYCEDHYEPDDDFADCECDRCHKRNDELCDVLGVDLCEDCNDALNRCEFTIVSKPFKKGVIVE